MSYQISVRLVCTMSCPLVQDIRERDRRALTRAAKVSAVTLLWIADSFCDDKRQGCNPVTQVFMTFAEAVAQKGNKINEYY